MIYFMNRTFGYRWGFCCVALYSRMKLNKENNLLTTYKLPFRGWEILWQAITMKTQFSI